MNSVEEKLNLEIGILARLRQQQVHHREENGWEDSSGRDTTVYSAPA